MRRGGWAQHVKDMPAWYRMYRRRMADRSITRGFFVIFAWHGAFAPRLPRGSCDDGDLSVWVPPKARLASHPGPLLLRLTPPLCIRAGQAAEPHLLPRAESTDFTEHTGASLILRARWRMLILFTTAHDMCWRQANERAVRCSASA